MNRSVVCLVGLLFAGLLAGSVHAQCQGGGGGRGGGSSQGSGMGMGSGIATNRGGGSMYSGPGSWAYDQMLGQALARQMAMQAYQKQMEDQARRAENLAKRQYFAAQRREQKLKTPAATPNSASKLLASNNGSLYSPISASQSLDILPGR
ncbi:hypothetical protein [Anatilimnocola floriformis]|uniref:hypothetical protein n=1 Tax=Anatilimnocola floriformis TaxID=2948575 RepID=UPI0020C457E8|nr:hypothetical protein [Anatilimnocola floriformis]